MAGTFNVSLTDAADADLETILDYVAKNHSPEKALLLLGELLDMVESLRSFPLRGNVPKELEALGINEFRQLVRKPYRLFYQVTDKAVGILLIADGRRDMEALLNKRLLGG